jgi:hypothetical protein
MLASFNGVYLAVQILELPAGIEPAISRLWATSGNKKYIGINFKLKISCGSS